MREIPTTLTVEPGTPSAEPPATPPTPPAPASPDGEHGTSEARPAGPLKKFYWRPLAEVREFFAVAFILRVSIVVSVLGSLAFVVPEQTREALRVMAEDRDQTYRPLALFALATIFFGLMSWYWGRVLLYLFRPYIFRPWKNGDPKVRGLGRWAAWQLPRLVGVMPLFAAAATFFYASKMPAADEAHFFLRACGYSFLVGGAVLYLLFVLRGRLLGERGRPVPAEAHGRGRLRWRDLPLKSWALLTFSFMLSLGLFALFTWTHGMAARWFGTAAIVMLAMGSWIPLGSIATWFGRVAHVPLLSLLLIAALVFNWFELNDNHMVRHYELPRPNPAPEFARSFDEWLSNRADLQDYDIYPVFIVTAEGGGLRAAYFTAAVLATIQDRCPAFAQHVFAVSGVSGGSLGASVFAALSSRKARNAPGQRCELNGGHEWRAKVDDVLSQDFLSPVVAHALYPDLFQRFLPSADTRLDRALALEIGLQRAWAGAHAGWGGGLNEFEQDFYKLWKDFPREATPALFLNTTRVETGERMVISNLFPLDDVRFNQLMTLSEVDPRAPTMLGVPLSTATFLSARFPLVTPPGYLPFKWEDEAGNWYAKQRYVDGGYFENSGAATAHDILSALHVGEKLGITRHKFRPIILRISNSPQIVHRARHSPSRPSYRTQGLDEIFSPIQTLLNTREARGATAVRQLRTAINTLQDNGGYADIIDFELHEDGVPMPLGWLLSKRARDEMKRQLDSPGVGLEGVRKVIIDMHRFRSGADEEQEEP